MATVECEYCSAKFSRSADLLRHQRKTKYCLRKRGLLTNPVIIKCSYCDTCFSRKDSLTRHLNNSCRSLHEKTYIKLLEQMNELKLEIAQMKNNQATTNVNNRNVVVNNLQPITDEDIQEQIENLTLDFILEGAKGFADFANSYPFKDRVLCTDKSRKKLRYRDEDGELVEDGGGHKLIQKFFQAISTRNEELINAEYNILQQEVESIAHNGRAYTSDLTSLLSKATRLQDLLQQCKDAAEGKDNDLTHEFIKHYIKIL